MALSEQLMAHVGAFKAEATDLVKTIIDEMTQEKQTYQPLIMEMDFQETNEKMVARQVIS